MNNKKSTQPLSPLHKLQYPQHTVWIKRDDLIHPIICGNKRRKISGYLSRHPHTTDIVTFGGAYSNHLRAIAYTGKLYDIQITGVVRGDELATKSLNDNLQFCLDQGMRLEFVDRQTYRQIKTSDTVDTITPHISTIPADTLIIPEGGCGPEGLRGTHDIISEIANTHNMSTSVYFCIEAGTGTTAAGCIQAINQLGIDRNTVIIPVLHDIPTISQMIKKHNPEATNYNVIGGYEHGGYAKITPELLRHNTTRQRTHDIPIEPIYSGKLMYAVDDLISQGYFPSDATIIIYHSGY